MIDLRQIAKLFLRLTVASSMLSAVADCFGLWPKELCMWGDMDKFIAYTQSLMPYIPADAVPVLAWIATVLEVLLSICLLIGLKLKWTASITGLMILAVAISMATSMGFKAPLDYSTFTASAAAFGILACGDGVLEIDNMFGRRRYNYRRIHMIR